MTLKDLLKIVPEGQWILLSNIISSEVYGFYYRADLGYTQLPRAFYDEVLIIVRAAANNTLEVVI